MISTLGFYSCESKTEVIDDVDLGYDYQPLTLGKYWEYKMDSILYDTLRMTTRDTTTSYYKEEIKDSSRNTYGDLVYSVDVFYRKNLSDGWDLIGSNFFIKDAYQLTKVEAGLRFIKLIFPAQLNRFWNGNSQINDNTIIKIKGEEFEAYKNWKYYYSLFNASEKILNVTYNKTCTVQEADDENKYEKRFSLVKYAFNVGMIYREQKFLATELYDGKIPFEDRAQRGVIVKQYLIKSN